VPDGKPEAITGSGFTVIATVFAFAVPSMAAVNVTWMGDVSPAGAV
jgi:hypothetical protein